jgi:uncharacterized protein (DUF58 family)
MPKTVTRSALGKYLDSRILSRLMTLRLNPRGRVIGDLSGDHKSPLSGFAVEFAGHREYVPGDDTKYIDWVAYSRHERYYIKQFEAETNMKAHILLDASASMDYGEGPTNKWQYGAFLCATLSHLVVAKRDKAAFGLFDERILHYMPPSQSRLQVRKIDELLEGRQPKDKTDLGRVLSEFAPRLGKCGLVIVVSDCFDEVGPLLRGLQRFRYDKHDVVLLHVLHRDELTFPFDGNVRFDGIEAAASIRTDGQQIRASYRRRFADYLDALTRGCEKIRVEYVLMDTSVPIEIGLAQYLAGRN